MSPDVRVAQQFSRVDVPTRARAFREVERHGEVADFKGPISLIGERDRPGQSIAVERKGLIDVKVRRRRESKLERARSARRLV